MKHGSTILSRSLSGKALSGSTWVLPLRRNSGPSCLLLCWRYSVISKGLFIVTIVKTKELSRADNYYSDALEKKIRPAIPTKHFGFLTEGVILQIIARARIRFS